MKPNQKDANKNLIKSYQNCQATNRIVKGSKYKGNVKFK